MKLAGPALLIALAPFACAPRYLDFQPPIGAGGTTTTSTTGGQGTTSDAGAGEAGDAGDSGGEGGVQCPPDLVPGSAVWSERFGDPGVQGLAESVAVDAVGNVVVAGSYSGPIAFGGAALPTFAQGSTNAFVAKLDAGGGFVWSKGFGDSTPGGCLPGAGACADATSAAIDASGRIVVTGLFNGSIDFGGGALASVGGPNMFVAKLAANGQQIWSERFGDTGTRGQSVTVDPLGNVLVVGNSTGSVTFGNITYTKPGLFVAKLDENGVPRWSKGFVNAQHVTLGNGVVTDAAGDVFVTGSFQGSIDFGGGTLTSAGAGAMFVAAFGSDGTHLWSRGFDSSAINVAWGIAVDSSTNVIVTGRLAGPVDFGGGMLTPTAHDLFVAKFGPGGVLAWSKDFKGSSGSTMNPWGTAVDALGYVYLTGGFVGSTAFGSTTVQSGGGGSHVDAFLASLDADGNYRWATHFGDQSPTALGVAVDPCGHVAVVGGFTGTIDFGGAPLVSTGVSDVFVAELAR